MTGIADLPAWAALPVALLLFVVFPWVEPQLPFNDVTVGD